jgi:2-haloacid dehalogenase
VNWRKSVVDALDSGCHAALNDATASLASSVRLRASNMTRSDWGVFAQEWRNTYKAFTRGLATDPSKEWISVDEHHRRALVELMAKWDMEGLWTDAQLQTLSLVWHHLVGWEDSATGMAFLNTKFRKPCSTHQEFLCI